MHSLALAHPPTRPTCPTCLTCPTRPTCLTRPTRPTRPTRLTCPTRPTRLTIAGAARTPTRPTSLPVRLALPLVSPLAAFPALPALSASSLIISYFSPLNYQLFISFAKIFKTPYKK